MAVVSVLVPASAAIAAASGWSIEPAPKLTDSSSQGVSCMSVRACTAVGEFSRRPSGSGELAARWNGHKWTIQHAVVPTGARSAGLNGVACTSTTACTAVGGYGKPLAERWNGG